MKIILSAPTEAESPLGDFIIKTEGLDVVLSLLGSMLLKAKLRSISAKQADGPELIRPEPLIVH